MSSPRDVQSASWRIRELPVTVINIRQTTDSTLAIHAFTSDPQKTLTDWNQLCAEYCNLVSSGVTVLLVLMYRQHHSQTVLAALAVDGWCWWYFLYSFHSSHLWYSVVANIIICGLSGCRGVEWRMCFFLCAEVIDAVIAECNKQ